MAFLPEADMDIRCSRGTWPHLGVCQICVKLHAKKDSVPRAEEGDRERAGGGGKRAGEKERKKGKKQTLRSQRRSSEATPAHQADAGRELSLMHKTAWSLSSM